MAKLNPKTNLFFFSFSLMLFSSISCFNSCGNISVNHPLTKFPYKSLLNCAEKGANNGTLLLRTSKGPFEVQSVDYISRSMTIKDPSMSTCTSLVSHKNPLFSPDNTMLKPQENNILVLLNCTNIHLMKKVCSQLDIASREKLNSQCPVLKDQKNICITGFKELGEYNMQHLGCSGYLNMLQNSSDDRIDNTGVKVSLNYDDDGRVPDIGEFCEKCDRDRGWFGIINDDDDPRDYRNCGIARECVCYPHRCEGELWNSATQINGVYMCVWLMLSLAWLLSGVV